MNIKPLESALRSIERSPEIVEALAADLLSIVRTGSRGLARSAEPLATDSVGAASLSARDQLAHTLEGSSHSPPALDAIALQIKNKHNLEASANDIRTEDLTRTLLRRDGYGDDVVSAMTMEKIIASTRNRVFSGELQNGAHVEETVAHAYLKEFYLPPRDVSGVGRITSALSDPRPYFPDLAGRTYSTAILMPKHRSYQSAFEAMASREGGFRFYANLEGENVPFIHIRDRHSGAHYELLVSTGRRKASLQVQT